MTQLHFHVDGPPAPALGWLAASDRLLALAGPEGVSVLVRIEDGYWGARMLRTTEFPHVLPPFTAADARALAGDPERWQHRFHTELLTSSASPLHRGAWALQANPDPAPWVPLASVTRWLRRDVVALEPTDEFGFETSLTGVCVVAPRGLSDYDDDRVKAQRRLAREGLLPPLLLWEASPLVGYVLLDGHDRLVAAAAEGVAPDLVVLRRVDTVRENADVLWLVDEYRQKIEQLTRAAAGGGSPDGIQRAQVRAAQALAHGLGTLPGGRTHAQPFPGGTRAWHDLARRANHSWWLDGDVADGV